MEAHTVHRKVYMVIDDEYTRCSESVLKIFDTYEKAVQYIIDIELWDTVDFLRIVEKEIE